MKTPDSRPRFRSATRHYHRYREENQDGWNNWVEGNGKPGISSPGGQKKWIVVAVGTVGIASLIGALVYNVF